jgi:2-keto-4-pentenoate hydratase/2-oxohepta-3-ene-1,7-dioic acid hydratase in catechol pathway
MLAGTGPFGLWLVTTEELPDPTMRKLQTRLNGSLAQASARRMLFSIPRPINYASEILTWCRRASHP